MHIKIEKAHFLAAKKRWLIEKQLLDPDQAEIESECAWQQLVVLAASASRETPKGLSALIPAIGSPALELLTQRPPSLITRTDE